MPALAVSPVTDLSKRGRIFIIYSFLRYLSLQRKSHLCIPFLGIAWPQSQFPHTCVCERFIYSQEDRSIYFPAAELADRSWKYINLSQIYECRNWETEHYNSVLEITVSFLGIHYWEPDIYLYWTLAGPSFALMLVWNFLYSRFISGK